VKINGLDLWQFENFLAYKTIKHFVTDRKSYPSEDGFTLSLSSLPDRSQVLHNRSLVADAMEIDHADLYFPSQVHKTRILHVTRNTDREHLLDTDALVSNEPGICIAVMSADCVPILLYDKKNSAVAAVHAGWRGTVAKILEKTLHEMNRLFGTTGEDLHAGIGPSVSIEAYEVGEEVAHEVIRNFEYHEQLLVPLYEKKFKLDLWNANKHQLIDFGVSPANIEISELCTVNHNHHFFSARKGDKGRFAAGIMLSH
jgi:YfiH family protein